MNEEETKRKAEEFAKANRKQLAKEFTDPEKYPPEETPISIFMAGSPGAGKTEFSENFLELLSEILGKQKMEKIIRIDGDEFRKFLPGYTGHNAHLFQGAISFIVEKVHDFVLSQKQTFVLDGTFSKYEKVADNVRRSVARGRTVVVFYVYQKPEVAWKFTQARETEEGRRVPKEAFIQQFIDARETVDRIRKEFDGRVTVFLVKKNFETHAVEDVVEIQKNGDQIDEHLGQRYSKHDLENLL